MKAVIRASGRKGAFSDEALTRLALVVKTASLGHSRATASLVQQSLGWGRSTTHKALTEAVRRGLVERVGRTKGAWYRIPEVKP